MLSESRIQQIGLDMPADHQPGWLIRFARAIESAACAERDARIAEMEQQLQAYEKHGVTCQTFRHFVSEPCAECNSPGRCARQLEQQLEEARKQMEAQKDEWLSWEAKRRDLEKDAELLDWLDNNMFAREPDEWDQRFGACRDGKTQMWAIFAPKGVHGSARRIIDEAIKEQT